MDVDRVIADLRRELEFLDRAILSLEGQGRESPQAKGLKKREKHRPRTVPDASKKTLLAADERR